MFRQFDDDNKETFSKGLDVLECMLLLKENNISIKKDVNVYIDIAGDGYMDLEEFWSDIFQIICGKGHYEEFMADNESAKLYDYDLPYDVDECGVYHLGIEHPAICKYLDKIREKRDFGSTDEWKEFSDLVESLVNYTYLGDYTLYEAIITGKSKGIIIICTDYYYFDIATLDNLLYIIEFCKNKLKEAGVSYE